MTKHKHLLYSVKEAKPKLRAAILKNSDDDFIKVLHEIAHNTLSNNVPLTVKQKHDLTKYKTCIRKLACPKRTLVQKRKQLVQKGGFLVGLLGSLLSSMIGL